MWYKDKIQGTINKLKKNWYQNVGPTFQLLSQEIMATNKRSYQKEFSYKISKPQP